MENIEKSKLWITEMLTTELKDFEPAEIKQDGDFICAVIDSNRVANYVSLMEFSNAVNEIENAIEIQYLQNVSGEKTNSYIVNIQYDKDTITVSINYSNISSRKGLYESYNEMFDF